jgi:flagellin-specific chaperone FliS
LRYRGVTQEQQLHQAHRDYLESRVLSASPVVITEMLYQLAISSLESTIRHLKIGDDAALSTESSRALGAVSELARSLDHSVGAKFSLALADLYAYTQHQIQQGQAAKSERPFRNALAVLRPLLEGWSGVCKAEAAKTSAQAPVTTQGTTPDSMSGTASSTTSSAGSGAEEPVLAPKSPMPSEAASQSFSPYQGAYQQEQELGSRDWSC